MTARLLIKSSGADLLENFTEDQSSVSHRCGWLCQAAFPADDTALAACTALPLVFSTHESQNYGEHYKFCLCLSLLRYVKQLCKRALKAVLSAFKVLFKQRCMIPLNTIVWKSKLW